MAVPNFKDNFFSMSPRLQGIEEQFERAKLFFNEAIASRDKLDRFRRFIAAIYFASAVAEIMVDAVNPRRLKNGVLKVKQDELRKILSEKLPRWELLRKLRIHDFHRVCVLERAGMFVKGPIELKPAKGKAKVQFTPQGPVVTKTGNSQVKLDGSLSMKGDEVFDEEQGTYVPLRKVLSDYLDAVPEVIEEFRKLQEKKSD